MKYTVKRPITGCINGRSWPRVGETIEIDADLAAMVEAGQLAVVHGKRVEKRPASKRVETRKD